VSIHRKSDGVFEVRWREGGRNKSLRVHGAYELAGKSNARRCRFAMRTGISMSNGRSTFGCRR
jgi:hypothetical protein